MAFSSVRLPLSLLGTFRAEAERQGISVHEPRAA